MNESFNCDFSWEIVGPASDLFEIRDRLESGLRRERNGTYTFNLPPSIWGRWSHPAWTAEHVRRFAWYPTEKDDDAWFPTLALDVRSGVDSLLTLKNGATYVNTPLDVMEKISMLHPSVSVTSWGRTADYWFETWRSEGGYTWRKALGTWQDHKGVCASPTPDIYARPARRWIPPDWDLERLRSLTLVDFIRAQCDPAEIAGAETCTTPKIDAESLTDYKLEFEGRTLCFSIKNPRSTG